MANVKDVHLSLIFDDSVDHAIDVRLVAVEQMPKFGVFRRFRATIRMLFEA
jgi:hypothetical protein